MTRLAFALAVVVLALVGCSPVPASPYARTELDNAVAQTVVNMETAFPQLECQLLAAAGYAVSPGVMKGGAAFGGAWGNGEVFEGGQQTGYCGVSQGTFGLQLGGQVYRELIIFRDRGAIERFKNSGIVLAMQVSGVGGPAGMGLAFPHDSLVEVYLLPTVGLMGEAVVGG